MSSQKIRLQDFHPWEEIREQAPKPLRYFPSHGGDIRESQPIEEDGKVFYDVDPEYASQLLSANPMGRYHLISPAKFTFRRTQNMNTETITEKAVKPLDEHPVGDKRVKPARVHVAAPQPLRVQGGGPKPKAAKPAAKNAKKEPATPPAE